MAPADGSRGSGESIRAKRYRAFLSYSREDERIARRIQGALERYRVPSGLEVKSLGADRRLGRFFRDSDEMGAQSDLGAAIRGALEDSEYLVVVCSPRAAKSDWVSREIVYFRRQVSADRILAAIVAGVPNTSGADECFPPALRSGSRGESTETIQPLAVDVRQEGLGKAMVRLIAGLLALPFDALWNRERRRQRRRNIGVAIAATLALVLALSIAGLVRGRQFVTQMASGALELLERREFKLEGRYGTNEALVGKRRVREASVLAIASLPPPRSLVDQSGPRTDCGSFGSEPVARCAALRIAYANPRQIGEVPFDLGYSGQAFVDRKTGDTTFLASDNLLWRVEQLDAYGVSLNPTSLFSAGAPFDVSGDTLLIGRRDGVLELVGLSDSRTLDEHKLFDDAIAGISVARDDALVLAWTWDGRAGVVAKAAASDRPELDVSQSALWPWSDSRTDQVSTAAFTGRSDAPVLSATRDGGLHWSAVNGRGRKSLDCSFEQPARRMELSHSARLVAVASETQVAVVDLNAKRCVLMNGKHAQSVSDLDFTQDEQRLLSAAHDNNVVIWSLETGDPLDVYSHGWHVESAAFMANDSRVVSATHHGDVWVWDLVSRSEILRLNGTEQAWPILVATAGLFVARPDGKDPALFGFHDLSALDSREQRATLCAGMMPTVELAELRSTYGLRGRPWDPCSWRGLGSIEGWRQLMRRWAFVIGLREDYEPG